MTEKEFILSEREMAELLRQETIGYLGLSAGDKPYVVPLNYAYIEGKILFHCALTGKKLDYLATNPRVCFTVARQSGDVRRHTEGDPCHPDSDSVICYGTARIIKDPEERRKALDAFNQSFDLEAEPISFEDTLGCGAVEIRIEEMTGRQERGRRCTFWRYRFE
jgi:nitroimidazol reductase NimA-like FMN-containing flavoprotein (pyridoxamine 5'-phosphate oxidase superfamily)